jgi:hypothetical protein
MHYIQKLFPKIMNLIQKISWLSLFIISIILSIATAIGDLDSPTSIAANNLAALSPDGSITFDSLDQHYVISQGDGTLGLANQLVSSLVQAEDGSIIKSRKTAMFSFGSELLNIVDTTNLIGTDALGGTLNAQFEKTITLKNYVYPFAMIREDLIALSSEGLETKDIGSTTTLILPDLYTSDEVASLVSALGESGTVDLQTIGFDPEMTDLSDFSKININLFKQFDMSQLLEILNNEEMWDMIKEEARKRQEAEANSMDADRFFASAGGIECRWGYQTG